MSTPCRLTLRGVAFFKLKIEYLQENEKVCKTVFVCSYGAQVEPFKQIKMTKNLVTATLRENVFSHKYSWSSGEEYNSILFS